MLHSMTFNKLLMGRLTKHQCKTEYAWITRSIKNIERKLGYSPKWHKTLNIIITDNNKGWYKPLERTIELPYWIFRQSQDHKYWYLLHELAHYESGEYKHTRRFHYTLFTMMTGMNFGQKRLEKMLELEIEYQARAKTRWTDWFREGKPKR